MKYLTYKDMSRALYSYLRPKYRCKDRAIETWKGLQGLLAIQRKQN